MMAGSENGREERRERKQVPILSYLEGWGLLCRMILSEGVREMATGRHLHSIKRDVPTPRKEPAHEVMA